MKLESTNILYTDQAPHTVRTIDLILRSIERRPQMQLSIARKFPLRLLRLYRVNHSKMRESTRHLA